MKTLLTALVVTILVAWSANPLLAAEQIIKGEAICAKCELHETAKCQTAIRSTVDGKDVIYYAVDNDVAKKFHKNVCQTSAKVTATGTVKEKDGKKMITLSKIQIN